MRVKEGAALRRRRERLPCNLTIEIEARGGKIDAVVYEISMEGILVSGAAAANLPLPKVAKLRVSPLG